MEDLNSKPRPSLTVVAGISPTPQSSEGPRYICMTLTYANIPYLWHALKPMTMSDKNYVSVCHTDLVIRVKPAI